MKRILTAWVLGAWGGLMPAQEVNWVSALYEGQDGTAGLSAPFEMTISPDDKHIYVVGSAPGLNTLAGFARNSITGSVTFLEFFNDGQGVDGLGSVRDVVVTPDGNHVYAAGLTDNAIAVFSRDAGSGLLTFSGTIADMDFGGTADGLIGPHGVIVSPDDQHVYVASIGDDAVAAFTRNLVTGALSLIEVEFNNLNLVTGLENPEELRLSPDGAFLYVAAETGNAVVVFERNPTTGELDYLETLTNGFEASGMDSPQGIAISDDGFVYINSELAPGQGDWITLFSRDAMDGTLTFVESYSNNLVDVQCNTGLFAGTKSAISPDGTRLYTSMRSGSAFVVFGRDTDTGQLILLQEECDPDTFGFGRGLFSLKAVDASADGRHVYTSGGEQAIAVFEVAAWTNYRNILADWPNNSMIDVHNALLEALP